MYRIAIFFFFFQAEDGIRDLTVTGVQTCALPISHAAFDPASGASGSSPWGGGPAAGGELSRQAGVDDVGRTSSSGDDTGSRRSGLLDEGRSEDVQDDQDADDLDDDFGFDDGGDDGSDP